MLFSCRRQCTGETMSTWRLTRMMVGAAGLALTACSTTQTSFTSTWRPGDATPVSAAGKKVAIVFINQNPGARRFAEDAMANEVARVGAMPIESYRILPDRPPEPERVRKELERAGADAIVTMRVVGVDQVTTADPT